MQYSMDHPECTYVGGFALSPFGIIEHAWAATPDGDVVDLVWEHPEESEYFGVPFDKKAVARAILNSGYYYVLLHYVLLSLKEPGGA